MGEVFEAFEVWGGDLWEDGSFFEIDEDEGANGVGGFEGLEVGEGEATGFETVGLVVEFEGFEEWDGVVQVDLGVGVSWVVYLSVACLLTR